MAIKQSEIYTHLPLKRKRDILSLVQSCPPQHSSFHIKEAFNEIDTPAAAPVPWLDAFHQDNAPAYWTEDILWLILASGEDTGGRWSMMEELCPKGSGAPPHVHIWSDETFYVLEGEVTFLMNGEVSQVSAGGFVVIPRNTVHGFRVDSEAARVLNSYIPASWETAVVALAEPAESRTLPPRDRIRPNRDRTTALMNAFGMMPVPGPDLLRLPNSDAPSLQGK